MFANTFLVNKLRQVRKSKPFLEMIPENVITVLIGTLFGLVLRYMHAQEITSTLLESFEPIFMIVLLPPILYSSALKMNKFYFFKNFSCISLYAFLGTLLAILSNTIFMYILAHFNIGPSFPFHYCLVFSSIISATDPVSVLSAFEGRSSDPNLYSLVFGESILNDAISLSFFRAINFEGSLEDSNEIDFILHTLKKFVVIVLVSLTLGALIGIIASMILKQLHKWTKMTQETLAERSSILFSSGIIFDDSGKLFDQEKIGNYFSEDNQAKNKAQADKKNIRDQTGDLQISTIVTEDDEQSETKFNQSFDNLLEQRRLVLNPDEAKPNATQSQDTERPQVTKKSSKENQIEEVKADPSEALKVSSFSSSSANKSQSNEIANLRQKLDQYINQEISLMLITPIVSYLIAEVD